MENQFDFDDLFVLDLANNHQGSVQHGLNIIQQVSEVVKSSGVRAAIKFQFRQLDTFVHPRYRDNCTNKHIPRFLSTRLSQKDFGRLLEEVKGRGFVSMCTPFDERSVDMIEEMDFDVIKIGSCSARDWPLLERVAEANKPVIFSTGGLHNNHINDLVSFLEHRSVHFAIMHCVSIYPTPDEHCHLNQIQTFRNRYPSHVIGWSTHENPDDTAHVQIAYAKGARMFERHIGVKTDKIKLNAYSSTPEQIGRWLDACQRARILCGSSERQPPTEVEKDSIRSLQRGVFAKTPIERGAVIKREQVYFAMPHQEGQLESGRWSEGIVAHEDFEKDAPVSSRSVELPKSDEVLVIKRVVHEVKAMLNQAGIVLNSEFNVEYSHHYGIKNFRETGAVIIECVNREYCKKLIVQLAGQKHPKHFHRRKEETFQILYGVFHAEVDGHYKVLHPGETLLILPGVWHRFWTTTGVIVEEISTTHFNNDSYYEDKNINHMERSARKTKVDHWGRFQLES